MLLLAALPLTQAQAVGLCAPAAPEREAALVDWLALEARRHEGGQLSPESLVALLEHPCLTLARLETQVDLAWPDAETATRWWADGGGRWLRAYLDPADYDRVFLPPDPRATLGPPEAGSPDPLAALRCPEEELRCGLETTPWIERAAHAYEAHAADASADARCETLVTQGYEAWRRCVGGAVGRGDALPLGRLRAPDAGWLVVRGPRGGLASCESVDVIDLSVGSVWTELRCPGRPPLRRAGLVPVAQAQELAWSLIMLSELQHETRVELDSLALPAGLERRWSAPAAGSEQEEDPTWSSAQTYLSWAWTPPEGPEVVAGYFTWPWSSAAGEDHVDGLLKELEASLQPACPPTRPDPEARAGRCAGEPPGVLLRDTLAAELLSWNPPECSP